ncbi:MAG: hypothetical protein EPO25_05115 [Gammaproteobacteria bacterium]|nr:MAG: hypothetical protein EPO25_05115 [Gammaproteobacteria bacterium]
MNKHTNRCSSGFRPGLRFAGMVVVSLLAVPAPTLAVDYTSTAGGGGGTSYSVGCGANQALVGVKGYAGSYIDGLQGICAQISYDGSWLGTAVETSFAGKSTGRSFSLVCPAGHAVSGVKGRAGSYIDQLKVRCGRLGPNGRLSSYGDYLGGTAGSTGGSAFGPFDCSSSQPAQLIRGKAGNWIDSLGLGCATVNTVRPSSLTISPVPVQYSGFSPGTHRATATVQMSLLPKAEVPVTLTTSNPEVALFLGGSTTASPMIRTYGDGSRSVSVVSQQPGCSTITASYQGASLSREMLVFEDDNWQLEFQTPNSATAGQAFDVSVRRLDPEARSASWTIELKNYENIAMAVPGLSTGALAIPAGGTGSIRVPEGSDGARFQLTVAAPGCVRIRATVGFWKVTKPVRVHPSLRPIGIVTR